MKIESTNSASLYNDLAKKSQKNEQGLAGLAEVDTTKMSKKELTEVRGKCEEVEAIFVKMMFEQMRKSIKQESSGSNAMDQGRDMYQEMLYEEYAKSITKQGGGIGVANTLYNQLTTPKLSAEQAIAKYNSVSK